MTYRVVGALAGACAVLFGGGSSFGQITKLDGLGSVNSVAKAVNDQGVVVGDYFGNFDGPFSFRFTPSTGMQQIPLPAGMTHSEVFDISDNGSAIVGQTYTSGQVQLMKSDGANSFSLGMPAGSTGAVGYGVNDSGTIVGNFYNSNGGGSFKYTTAGGFETITGGVFDARGITNGGTIGAQHLDNNGYVEGVRLGSGGAIQGIGGLGGQGSMAFAINESGIVVGESWDGNNIVGVRQAPGGALKRMNLTMHTARAIAISSTGYQVGYQNDLSLNHAALWKPDGTLVNLDQWLDVNFPSLGSLWDLNEANGINKYGRIVGKGTYHNPGGGGLSEYGFILDAPQLVPEPGMAGALVAMSGAWLLRRGRRG